VLSVFGTRPEAIKLAPVLRAIDRLKPRFHAVNVITAQHTDMLDPFLSLFEVRVDHNLFAMRHGQGLNQLLARLIAALDPILLDETPDVVMVQGDTTSALAGALAAFHHRIPVAHVEAGLRSANPLSPFPEEMNRRLISKLSTYHFAPTATNVDNLIADGIALDNIALTGNPVVDSVRWILGSRQPSAAVETLLAGMEGCRLIVLTTHRRENFGAVMSGHLEVLKRFVDAHDDVTLVFPVHANPVVREAAQGILGATPRVHLVPPMDYPDFLHIMARAWLIVSDSGGVQEEVPTLGKPLLVLRQNTERPEAVACGIARLVGDRSEALAAILEEISLDDSWIRSVTGVENPFGCGDSGERIVAAMLRFLERDNPEFAARWEESGYETSASD
jgi:UDP-N-acetylglucosamine 2-epimerase (non-hydrolysing)